ncbi:RNA polymerase sigma-70 factor (ECF subfamily) [Geothermobacter ehrlichii]|uniref:RNA polymerase sigma-70 factor (ECF subfamily) n=1 Tax=Geothermobacter ehrlichii TaxID=213224 RepID=A0A5D3WMA9_9BACT|nr:sigma-70 family RNA polymerase sigma factor [Geothermobacter ehrlichii]TYO99216.1 RNA polymerase sigma-70 factor (ECF subfamily) [Geothermobacter ehrlichii]
MVTRSAPAVAIVDSIPVDGYSRSMVDRDEEILLQRAREGDDESFARLVERHIQPLINLGWRMTGSRDLAEDLAQETFLRLHRSLGSFRGDSSLATWLYRTLSRLAIDHLRREKLKRRIFFFRGADDEGSDPVELAADPGPGPDEELQARESVRRLRQALQQLSPQQRAVFTLRHDEGLPLKEIATALGLSEGTVKAHLHRAVQTLRTSLGDLKGA